MLHLSLNIMEGTSPNTRQYTTHRQRKTKETEAMMEQGEVDMGSKEETT